LALTTVAVVACLSPAAVAQETPVDPQTQRITLLTDRLIDVYNRLYVATPEAERPTLLTEMLDDPVVAVRLLALSLIERKVLNAQPIDEAVRGKVRLLLDHESARVRAATAGLLRIVDDAPSVDLVIERLADEEDATVRNAYLSLLARQPTDRAVPPAIDLLSEPANTAAAAQLLVRAIEQNQLTPEQRKAALAEAVALANNGEHIEPAAVRLVGRLATENQAALMRKLLDHSDDAVRLAAADAFVVGTLNHQPLMERLGDPVLGPRAVAAAARHGDSLKIAMDLLKREPTDAERRKPWRSAIAAVAGRLAAPDLRKLDDAVLTAANHQALREAVLKLALTLPADKHVPDRTEMLLRLGEAQVAAGRIDALGQTLEAIDAPSVAERNRGRLLRIRIEQQLAQGQYEEAAKTAEALLAADKATASWLTGQLLDAVENALGGRKTEQAGVLLVRIEAMLGESMSQSDRQRYDELRKRLNELLQPAETLGSGG